MYFCNMNNTEQMKNMDAAMQYLQSAENGEGQAQKKLCEMFYADSGLAEKMPEDFWNRIETAAQSGEDYANFIMHCRYFGDPQQGKAAYDYIRKAIRHAKAPLAFIRIAEMFAGGIYVRSNNVLASYYHMKAFEGGCEEVADMLKREYESGTRNLVNDIVVVAQQTGPVAQRKMDMFRRLIDKDRAVGNYGALGKLCGVVKKIYPEYNIEEAKDDILNGRDTLYADLYYSFCTSNNNQETSVDLMESLLEQLYAPMAQNRELIKQLYKADPDILPENTRELIQCIVNFNASYDKVCKRHKIKKKEMQSPDTLKIFPYIPISTLAQLRKDAFRSILSVKDIDERINDEYLTHLDDDQDLMNITEKINNDQDLQLMLISFVELNIDIQAIEITYTEMLHSYMNGNIDCLVRYYNELLFVSKLAGYEPPIENLTEETLPPINLPI